VPGSGGPYPSRARHRLAKYLSLLAKSALAVNANGVAAQSPGLAIRRRREPTQG
jgi:hypothetical protein